jgi:hypothetical protein
MLMTTYIDTKIISLTSQSANVQLNGSYLSNLRYNNNYGLIGKDPTVIHKQIQVLHMQLPYSWYVVNYSNQVFQIKLGAGSIQTLSIPVGNYTGTSMIAVLKTAVNDVNFVITLSSINGKLTFSYNTSFIIYNTAQYSIASILGFSSNSTNASVLNTLTASFPLNLLGIKNLHLRSGNLVMNNFSSVQGGATTLLSSIPVSAVPFGMIEFKDLGDNRITIYNDCLDDLDLEIVSGEDGNYINFNGQDWCVTLALHLTKLLIPTGSPRVEMPGTQTEAVKRKPNKDLGELNILTSE